MTEIKATCAGGIRTRCDYENKAFLHTAAPDLRKQGKERFSPMDLLAEER